jgi:MmyB-like transcription regulator ligand binding domain
VEWECVADDLVAHLRSKAGRHPHDRGLSDLVGHLSTRSAEFRTRWAVHNVRFTKPVQDMSYAVVPEVDSHGDHA